VAGTASLKDAQDNYLTGAGEADGFGFKDRPLNPYVFTSMQTMSDTSKAAEVFRCPSDTERWEGYGNSYAGNTRPNVEPYCNFEGQVIPYWRALNFTDVMTVQNASRVILAGDGGWMQSVRNEGPPWMFWHLRPYVHNMLFLDGHVAFLKVEAGQIEGETWQLDAGTD
jgi:prepilin-type processing-associated H-X9-DG protein